MIVEYIAQDEKRNISYLFCKDDNRIIKTIIPTYPEGTILTDVPAVDELYHVKDETDSFYNQVDLLFSELYPNVSLACFNELVKFCKNNGIILYDTWVKNPYSFHQIRHSDATPILSISLICKLAVPTTFYGYREEVKYITEYMIDFLKNKKGSLCFPIKEVWEMVNYFFAKNNCKHKQITIEDFVAFINFFDNTFHIYDTEISFDTLLSLESDFCAEERIYMNLCQFINKESPFSQYESERIEGLSVEQQLAVNELVKHKGNIAVLSGGPGTGKSTTLEHIVTNMKKCYPNEKIALLAPTGKAAKRIQEVMGNLSVSISTIHKFLGLTIDSNAFIPQEVLKNIKETHFVIIDEASMLGISIFSRLLQCLDMSKTKILLVGDIHQLPSIEAGFLLRDLIHLGVYIVDLKTNFRSNLSILNNSKNINSGKDIVYNTFFELRCYDIFNDIDTIAYDEDAVILSPYVSERYKDSSKNINEYIHQKNFISTNYRVKFFVGETVIVTRTQYNHKKAVYVNGDIGTVTSILQAGDGTYEYYINLSGETTKVPESDLDYGYALTIHKSQGSEYKTVYLTIKEYSPFITRKMLYTAVTRAKEKVVVYSTKEIIQKIIMNDKDSERITYLSQKTSIG